MSDPAGLPAASGSGRGHVRALCFLLLCLAGAALAAPDDGIASTGAATGLRLEPSPEQVASICANLTASCRRTILFAPEAAIEAFDASEARSAQWAALQEKPYRCANDPCPDVLSLLRADFVRRIARDGDVSPAAVGRASAYFRRAMTEAQSVTERLVGVAGWGMSVRALAVMQVRTPERDELIGEVLAPLTPRERGFTSRLLRASPETLGVVPDDMTMEQVALHTALPSADYWATPFPAGAPEVQEWSDALRLSELLALTVRAALEQADAQRPEELPAHPLPAFTFALRTANSRREFCSVPIAPVSAAMLPSICLPMER